jgi:hypothetical protein
VISDVEFVLLIVILYGFELPRKISIKERNGREGR